jgi:RNA polymerase sigma-54 factor
MALTPRLDLRQTQSLVMTPQLQQAIKLLQLSNIELRDYVESQIEQNPLLERDEGSDAFGVSPAMDSEAKTASEGNEPLSVDLAVGNEGPTFTDSDLDFEMYDNVFDTRSSDVGWATDPLVGRSHWQGRGGSFDADASELNQEEMLSRQTTLRDHLAIQLAVEISDPVDRIIATHLIDMLDEAGYLRGDISQVAEVLGCSVARVESTLARLQGFEPAGIFARSLAECLALQLQERGQLDRPTKIILDHLELLGQRDWPGLARLCGIHPQQLTKPMARIRSCDPKPALAFDLAVTQPVIPDVIMRPQHGGGWLVELNNEVLPKVLINNQYYAQISSAPLKRKDKQYISECFQSANWLVKSLHQRATTILKVATEIIRQQHDFFINGVQSLKPLVLRDIADAISMHESTVSRVTSQKFVGTPRGIYELKYFFTHAIGGSNGGDSHSAESVRHRIKKLIDAEVPQAVLSDDALAEALQKEGIDIARRTVAKYREAMRIPSSVQRRREKSELLDREL